MQLILKMKLVQRHTEDGSSVLSDSALDWCVLHMHTEAHNMFNSMSVSHLGPIPFRCIHVSWGCAVLGKKSIRATCLATATARLGGGRISNTLDR